MEKTTSQTQQTMTFSDSPQVNTSHSVLTASDPTRTDRYAHDADLGDFLSRPIKIDTRQWAVDANIHHTFDPWSAFFGNKRVINRINNYKLLKATLKLKFVINGNGFYYGRALASYWPLAIFDDLGRNRSTVSQDIISASQKPHVFLNPTTSQGGELTLPFFYYYDFLSIPDQDWDRMGQITIRSINELVHANGGTEPVTITTFAWAEDVELAIPTSVNSDALIPQSGIKLDEIDEANEGGVVSGPASTIGAAAARLSRQIPAMSPMLTATSMAANMTSSAARLFGYSRPPITKAPEPYQPRNSSSLALCTVPDTTEKLTVDDKQGLGMGHELAGIQSEDPLTILSIAQRESYLTTFIWPVASDPDTLLWNIRVNPTMLDVYSGTTPPEMHLTPVAVASLPFEYWSGTLTYRFQVVCSSFHRGRLRVVYDPEYLSSNVEYNVNYQEIVDITEKQDFTVTISNSQDKGILDVPRAASFTPANNFSNLRFTSNTSGSNGVIGLYVVNELVTPNTSLNVDAQVNVYVKAGDDFRVYAPHDEVAEYEFVPESGIALDTIPSSDDAVNDTDAALHPSNEVTSNIVSVYAGESIESFRPLIKRYNKHSTAIALDQVPSALYSIRRNSFPYLRGAAVPAVDVTATATGYNYAWTPLFQYLTMAFAAWRGSIRHRMIPCIPGQDGQIVMAASRSEVDGYAQAIQPVGGPVSLSTVRYTGITGNFARVLSHGSEGKAYTTSAVNDVLSFEIPFQKPHRFALPRKENLSGAQSIGGNAFDFGLFAKSLETAFGFVDWHVAAGEDYQVYFWLGMPPLYYTESEPAPG